MTPNHTITSGMISGVDRRWRARKYYQTDAAINPGNSGGPSATARARCSGLVTFKFTDAHATGFAIPLFDLDLKAFVPLTARKTGPSKEAEMVKLAENIRHLVRPYRQSEGMNSPDRKILQRVFRHVLPHGPGRRLGNTGIYYNIGMLLAAIGENEVAAGYLTRALELQPWDKNNGNPYREVLGLSLAAEKREADAIVVWREGLANLLYAAKIWEDMAVTYSNQQKYVEAGTAAATVLFSSPRTSASPC